MKTTLLEAAVINRMLADPALAPMPRKFDVAWLIVAERDHTEVGFITSFARTSETRLFDEPVSIRWGKVVGRLNLTTDADFIIYVDEGYLVAVEGCTFGGEPWPEEVAEFELSDLPAP